MSAGYSRLFGFLLSVVIFSIGLSIPAFAKKPSPPPPPPPPPPLGTTTMISVTPSGTPGQSGSGGPSSSADVRYVGFSSFASDIVAGDTNNVNDAFVRDRVTGITERVSVASDGTQGDDRSGMGTSGHAMSADGRYVVFGSVANNLVSGPQNFYEHVYVHDRVAHTTERVSVATDGTPANNWSYPGAISADGRYVVFMSYATNLAPGDTNNMSDVFVRDLVAGTTERVSLGNGGVQGDQGSRGGVLNGDGRYVGFISDATNLVANDTNGVSDTFVFDRAAQTVERVSISSAGVQGDGWSGAASISTDGRFVAFSSSASTLVVGDTNGYIDVFVRDLVAGATERVSVSGTGAEGNDDSFLGAISPNGRFVGFDSFASNLVPGDTNFFDDSFIRDRLNGVTERVSLATDGTQANSDGGTAIPNSDGQLILFNSYSTNLVPGQTGVQSEVFLRERSSP